MGLRYPNLSAALGVPEDAVISTLDKLQPDLASVAADIGAETRSLRTKDELPLFARSFERQFVIPYAQRDILLNFYVRHVGDALVGAMVAVKQMNAAFGGEVPPSGAIGMVAPRAAFLGVGNGNDWDSQPNIAVGALLNWVHSGSTFMAGTAGNPVRIGKNQVSVLIGYGDRAPSPKAESLLHTLDGKPQPGYILGLPTKQQPAGDNSVTKEFDSSILLVQGRQILAQLFSNDAGQIIPFYHGFSFIPENILRQYVVPTGLPGTTNDVITTV